MGRQRGPPLPSWSWSPKAHPGMTTSAEQSKAAGRINPTTHRVTEFALPGISTPYDIVAAPGADGGNLWFTDPNNHRIGEINATTYAINEFTTGNISLVPYRMTLGSDGNLWF